VLNLEAIHADERRRREELDMGVGEGYLKVLLGARLHVQGGYML
jgi:hypothetical protein